MVVGWGKAGKSLAKALGSSGRRVVLVEQSPQMYGGTCINIGCVPTKALVHQADSRRDGDDPQSYFTQAVNARDTLIAKLNEVNLHLLADRDTVTVVDGQARFVGPQSVEVSPTAGGAGLSEHLRITAETIVVNTGEHFLYFVLGGGKALRYGIGTAKTGFEWSGTHRITNKREWPDWTPPREMLARRPDIPTHMEGGINNPLGARALYIGSTLYRIHGTTEPWTIVGDVSSCCIRMVNDDVIDLYGRVKIGAKVIVL